GCCIARWLLHFHDKARGFVNSQGLEGLRVSVSALTFEARRTKHFSGDSMATVYKRTRLKPVPAGAEFIVRNGKRWARWTDPKTGLKKRAPLNAAGDKIEVELGNYCISYFDHNGRRVVESAKTCDRDAAELLAAKRQTEVMHRSKGLIDVAA